MMRRALVTGWFVIFWTGILASSGSFAAETLLERGAYLMRGPVACGNWHSPWTEEGRVVDMEFTGGVEIPTEGFTAFPSNITPDPETGIGRWTDDQLIAAIREGVRPDGSIIGPPMPIVLYRQLSDRDVQGLVAYLRTVTPIRNVVPPSEYRMPLPPAYGPPVGQIPDVPRDDPVRYGAYLVAIAHCMECHSPLGPRGPDVQNRAGAGGQPIEGPWGVVVSPNITPDRETGIGGWTDEQIKAAIAQAIRPAAGAADALRLFQGHDTRRPRRHRRLSAHGPANPERGAVAPSSVSRHDCHNLLAGIPCLGPVNRGSYGCVIAFPT